MAIHELNKHVLVYPAILPASTNVASIYSSAIDTTGFEKALVILLSGTNTTGAEVDMTVREGAARTVSTTHVHVAGSSFTQVTTSNDNTVYVGEVDLRKRLRYISLWQKRDGTNEAVAGAVVVLFGKKYAPSTQYKTLAFSI